MANQGWWSMSSPSHTSKDHASEIATHHPESATLTSSGGQKGPKYVEVDSRNSMLKGREAEIEMYVHETIQHTAGGILVGMTWGGYRGAVQNAHLRNTYGEFRDTARARQYRVPMNIVGMASEAASMGWKLGFLAGAFTGCRGYIRMHQGDWIAELQKSDNGSLRSAAALLKGEAFHDLLPTGAAGTLVGTVFGAFKGSKGLIMGMLIGGGLSFGLGGLQGGLQSWADNYEKQLTAQNSSAVSDATNQQGTSQSVSSRTELMQQLQQLRKREKAEGTQLGSEKAAVKKKLKELP